MIREIIKPTSRYLSIKIPDEYINSELEVIVFSKKDLMKSIQKRNKSKDILEEFERINKGVSLSKGVKYELKMEDEINNDIF